MLGSTPLRFRRLFYRQRCNSNANLPGAWWPRQYTLRELFEWTTWFAVIFAALGAVNLPLEQWGDGTLALLAPCCVALLIVQVRPRGESSVLTATRANYAELAQQRRDAAAREWFDRLIDAGPRRADN